MHILAGYFDNSGGIDGLDGVSGVVCIPDGLRMVAQAYNDRAVSAPNGRDA